MNAFSLGGVVGAVYFLMSENLLHGNLVVLQCVGTCMICTVAHVMHVPKYLQMKAVAAGGGGPQGLAPAANSININQLGARRNSEQVRCQWSSVRQRGRWPSVLLSSSLDPFGRKRDKSHAELI